MAREVQVRRHADGALDIDHHRRRARRLRNMTQRRAWRAVFRALEVAAARLGRAARRPVTAAIGSPRLLADVE